MSNTIQVNAGDDNIHHSIMKDGLGRILAENRTQRVQAEDMLHQVTCMLAEAERLIAEQKIKIGQLESLACSDPLTGAMNRRGFEKFMLQEGERIRRYNAADSLLVLIDLDSFKYINDTYGHAAGDACLKHVSQYLMSYARISDGVARLGGDEFVLLMTQMPVEKSASRIYDLCLAMNDMSIEWKGQRILFTASIGIEHMRGDSDCMTVMDRADRKLFEDKKSKKAQSLARLNFPEIM